MKERKVSGTITAHLFSQYAYLSPRKILIVLPLIHQICSMTQKLTTLPCANTIPFCIILQQEPHDRFPSETMHPKWLFVCQIDEQLWVLIMLAGKRESKEQRKIQRRTLL